MGRPSEDEAEPELDISSPDVVTKYKAAADFANSALAAVSAACVAGKSVVELCDLGDKVIKDGCATVYNKAKKMTKGVAFPTCISINEIVGHNSPLASECTQVLAEGDMVKIDLGCHIDGFVAVVANTIIVGEEPASGRKADVIAAARTAADCALRTLKPGNKNTQVTQLIQKVAQTFKVECVEGVLSHQMKRFVIDGNKTIMNKSTPEQKVDEIEFLENETYAIDIVMSTGEGRPKETELRTTVFKRAVDQNYQLKMKASRAIFSEINKTHPTMPFTLREFDEKTGRLGVVECVKHELLQPYPVLHEKPGEFVAHVKLTALVMPNGTLRITGPQQEQTINTEVVIEDEEVKAVLATSLKKKKPKKKKAAEAEAPAS
jgi:curved DNA binding protein